VYIHCANGVGRAPTTAAAYFISTGLSADEAWSKIRRARPFIRPTQAQKEMIDQLAAKTKAG
jgi:atypical dual specificity phosphatase